jgi:hypothetical protein
MVKTSTFSLKARKVSHSKPQTIEDSLLETSLFKSQTRKAPPPPKQTHIKNLHLKPLLPNLQLAKLKTV